MKATIQDLAEAGFANARRVMKNLEIVNSAIQILSSPHDTYPTEILRRQYPKLSNAKAYYLMEAARQIRWKNTTRVGTAQTLFQENGTGA